MSLGTEYTNFETKCTILNQNIQKIETKIKKYSNSI